MGTERAGRTLLPFFGGKDALATHPARNGRWPDLEGLMHVESKEQKIPLHIYYYGFERPK